MKYRHLTVILIALSLVAIAFMPIVAAEITPGNATYNVVMFAAKYKNILTLTIDTTGKFDGNLAHDIQLTYYDFKNNPTTITPTRIDLSQNLITITLFWGKEVPPNVGASNAVGYVGTTGETFYAAGPAWGWGAHF